MAGRVMRGGSAEVPLKAINVCIFLGDGFMSVLTL
jgi:hypothetical protein